MQANWKPNLQVTAGNDRTLNIQSSPIRINVELGIFVYLLFAEPKGIIAGTIFAPK